MTSESEIFQQIVSAPSPEVRASLLEQYSAHDPALRLRLQQLLQAHADAGATFLRESPRELATTFMGSMQDLSGQRVGSYKLLQRIGEGGFGDVYMAEQELPIRRKVALKVIKPGMDSREVIARFESERQALAIMEHPNIAQVYDAGTTESGQPYFVMELVRGVPITEFCDRNRLSFQERLQLFMSVCNAIQHAHYKGVIHRDIKPSNVLVTLHDGLPVVKVIDFGVAKATAQKLTERTLFTAWGQMIGTPAYMSPEQAEMSGLDIDTRSDVYSLGVLLYELLTGSTPLDVRRLREAGYAQMQKIISEQEPQRPSLRISSLGQDASVLAGHRSTDVKRWIQSLEGDLDWIVLKTLERDRNRRYATPSSLASDLERFLRGEAIEARPPSLIYRLQRVYHRHRAAVLAATGVCLLLLLASLISTSLAVRASRAEQVAERRRHEAEASREQLLQALKETDAARNEAQQLTAQVAVSTVTLDFTEQTLLKLAQQLPKLAQTLTVHREFIKLNLYGALQFIAAGLGESGGLKRGVLQHRGRRLHAMHDGILVMSEQARGDVGAYDLQTGHRLLYVPQVFTDGSEVEAALLRGQVLCAIDFKQAVGLHVPSGKQLWTYQHAGFGEQYEDGVSLSVNRQLTSLQGLSVSVPPYLLLTTEEPGAAVILNLQDGRAVSLPSEISDDVEYEWSHDRSLLAIVVDAVRVVVVEAASGNILLDQSEVEGYFADLAFAPDQSLLAVAVTPPRPGESTQIHLWKRGQSALRRIEQLVADFSGADLSFPDSKVLSCRIAGDVDHGTVTKCVTWMCEQDFDAETFAAAVLPEIRTVSAFVLKSDGESLLAATPSVSPWETDPLGLLNRENLSFIPLQPGSGVPSGMEAFTVRGRFFHDPSLLTLTDLAVGLDFPGTYWKRVDTDAVSNMVLCGNPGYFDLLLPLDIEQISDSDLLLLVDLVACGSLDHRGLFVPWDEATFAEKLALAESRGLLAIHRAPHLQAYLKQPDYWSMKQLLLTGGKAELHGRTLELLDRVSSRMSDFTAGQQVLSLLSSIENIPPEKRLGLEVLVAEKWPQQYWSRAEWSSVPDAEILDAVLVDAPHPELVRLLARWFQLREQESHDTAAVALSPQDSMHFAWCLFHSDRVDEAIDLLQRTAAAVRQQHAATAATAATADVDQQAQVERQRGLVRLTAWQYVLLAEAARPAAADAVGRQLAELLHVNHQSGDSLRKAWPQFAEEAGETGSLDQLLFHRLARLLTAAGSEAAP